MLREINEYLFHEFGFVDGEDRISDEWPFVLCEVGTVRGAPLMQFRHEDEDFYVPTDVLNFLPVGGMGVDDFTLADRGVAWLAQQRPVDLNTTSKDDSVPRILERRGYLYEVASSALPGADLKIVEGLFLQASGRQLALVTDGDTSWLVGDGVGRLVVPFPKAATHIRVGWAVAKSELP